MKDSFFFFIAKDVDFINTISEEVVDYVVEQAIVLFKVSVGETKTNLYGESLGKVWHAPATLMAIVDREPQNVVYEGFGADKQQAVEFRFNIDWRVSDEPNRPIQMNMGWMLGYRKQYYNYEEKV